MSHHCENFILSCMDYRLPHEREVLMQKGILTGKSDLVKVPGGVLALVHPAHEKEHEFLIKALKIAIETHGAVKIILINHEDCGAYGTSQAFKSKEEEKAQHMKDLNRAHKLICERFGKHLKIVMLYAEKLDEAGEEWEFGEVKG